MTKPTAFSDPAAPPPSNRAWLKGSIAAVVLIALIALFAWVDVRSVLRPTLDFIADLGPLGPALFIAVYVLACVFFIPGSVLTLGAGAVFGVVWGSIYVSAGATLGAGAAFLVGRHLARDWVAKKIEGNASFAAIDRAVAAEGWKIVALTRLSPVFPFTLLNYAFGLTRVSFRDYVLASWIGMMPGTVMYVYLGSLAQVSASGQKKSSAEWALYGVGLIATLAVTVFVTRLARRALDKRTQLNS